MASLAGAASLPLDEQRARFGGTAAERFALLQRLREALVGELQGLPVAELQRLLDRVEAELLVGGGGTAAGSLPSPAPSPPEPTAAPMLDLLGVSTATSGAAPPSKLSERQVCSSARLATLMPWRPLPVTYLVEPQGLLDHVSLPLSRSLPPVAQLSRGAALMQRHRAAPWLPWLLVLVQFALDATLYGARSEGA